MKRQGGFDVGFSRHEEQVTGHMGKWVRLKSTTAALRHREFRVYFIATFISFVGTWMQAVAQSWLVYRLTDSAWLLGLVNFANMAPVFLLAPLGGVVVDRQSRRKIVMLTQAAAMAQAFLLGFLTLADLVTVEWVIGMAAVLGVVNAVDMPARQALVVELVERRDLMNAIALNSSVVNGARIVGPAVAGVLVAWVGEGVCFLINGLTYFAMIGALYSLNRLDRPVTRSSMSALSDLREGFEYVRRTRPVRVLLYLVALVSLFGFPFVVLMPIFADRVLSGGPRALGLLLGAAGGGALLGGLTLASRRRIEGLGKTVAMSAIALGISLILFSISRSLVVSAALLVVCGFTMMLQMSGSNTLLQSMVRDELRGRLMSFYSMSLVGMAPFGSLLAGAVAERIGAPYTVAGGGALCIIGGLAFLIGLPALRKEAAPILVAQGVIAGEPPEAATSMKPTGDEWRGTE